MTAKTFTGLSLLLTAFVFYSCTASKEEQKELNKIPVREIKEKVNKQFKLIESIEAYGTISIDSPELSNTASIEVRIKKPDSVYVKIEGPFGIDIAVALITSGEFIYYNVKENKVITGPSTDLNIGAILKIRVSFDELINSFSGSFYFIDQDDDSLDAASEENAYVLTVSQPRIKRKYLIEPNSFVVNNYYVLDVNDNKLLEVNYSSFDKLSTPGGELNFPNHIKLHKPDRKQTVWLQYDTKEINKKGLNFKIKYPKSAKVIKWN